MVTIKLEVQVQTQTHVPGERIDVAVRRGELGIPELEFGEGEKVDALQVDPDGGKACFLRPVLGQGVAQLCVFEAEETHVLLPEG